MHHRFFFFQNFRTARGDKVEDFFRLKESATVLHKFAEASDRIQFSINASSIASNGATSPGGARTCGFKAALPRERLNFCALLSNVAVRSYDGALRSSMVVVGGVEPSSRHLAAVMVPGTLELNMTHRT